MSAPATTTLVSIAGRAARQPWRAARTWLRQARSFVLDMAGLACLCAAGFVAHTVAGLVVTGLSCFVLQWRIREAE